MHERNRERLVMQRETERWQAAEALDCIDRRAIQQAEGTMVVDGARYTVHAAESSARTRSPAIARRSRWRC